MPGKQYSAFGNFLGGTVYTHFPCTDNNNPGNALFFSFQLDRPMGVDVRTFSLSGSLTEPDTRLAILSADLCTVVDPQFCNEDMGAANTLSAINAELPAGSYVFVVGASNPSFNQEAFALTATFYEGCRPQCDATAPNFYVCGDNGCGGSCYIRPDIVGLDNIFPADCPDSCGVDGQCGPASPPPEAKREPLLPPPIEVELQMMEDPCSAPRHPLVGQSGIPEAGKQVMLFPCGWLLFP